MKRAKSDECLRELGTGMVEMSVQLLAPLQQQLLWRCCGNSHDSALKANQATRFHKSGPKAMEMRHVCGI